MIVGRNGKPASVAGQFPGEGLLCMSSPKVKSWNKYLYACV